MRDESGDNSQTIYAIIGKRWILSKCKGCEGFNLTVVTKDFGDVPPINEFRYPTKTNRNIPKWITELPIKYVELFSEVYSALNSDLLRLALMGSRTIIETFIIDNIEDKGTFKQKLEKLAEDGILAKGQIDTLYSAIDAGNSAAHRGYNPSIESLNMVLDITEYLIQSIILKRSGISIENETPKGKKDANKSS